MKRIKPATVILLSFVLQFIALFWSESGFVRMSDISLPSVEKRLEEDGMPAGQRQDVSAALREIRFAVTNYANTLGLQLIMLNAMTLFVLFVVRARNVRPGDEA
jgi:hypothetical protein